MPNVIKRTIMVEEFESAKVDIHCTSIPIAMISRCWLKKGMIWNYFGIKGDKSGKPVKEDINKLVCKLRK